MSDNIEKNNVDGDTVETTPLTPLTDQVPENPATTQTTQTTPLTPPTGQVPENPATTQATYSSPEKEIDKLYKLLYGVMIAVVIAFFIMLFDFIKDKDVIVNYGNLSDKYFDRYLELNDSFDELNLSIKDEKIKYLEEKNSELATLTSCLKGKKYWQYDECFK
jgi:hypothetical protein